MNTAEAVTAPAVREVRPQIDLLENADELLLLADVPGATLESVNIRFENALLTLQAERTKADGRVLRYTRSFQLPESIDPDKISAELKNGVLQVHLPKFEKVKARTIAISSN